MIRGRGGALQVNVATALHRLARLHCTSATTNAATIIVTSAQFRLLLAAIRKLLPRFEVRRPFTPASPISALETQRAPRPSVPPLLCPVSTMHTPRAPRGFSPDATPGLRPDDDARQGRSGCPRGGRRDALALHAEA